MNLIIGISLLLIYLLNNKVFIFCITTSFTSPVIDGLLNFLAGIRSRHVNARGFLISYAIIIDAETHNFLQNSCNENLKRKIYFFY